MPEEADKDFFFLRVMSFCTALIGTGEKPEAFSRKETTP
jgi:hypothetical protein